MAQLAEQLICNQQVNGSSPFWVVNGILAQLGEHLPYKQRVIGSSPIGPININRPHLADVAQLAEQLICNQQVIGSSPIIGLWMDSRVAKGDRL